MPLMAPSPDSVAARIRAAAAYADLHQHELADAIGYGRQQVARYMKGTQEPKAPTLWAIADVCHVPRWFMEHGWEHHPATPDETDRLARLEELVLRNSGLLEHDRAALAEMRGTLDAIAAAPSEQRTSRARERPRSQGSSEKR
jgi:transcriptional regulator with XRE-family HTH domain